MTKLSSSSNLYDQIKSTAAFQNFEESRFDRDFQSDNRNIRKESVQALSINIDFEKEVSSTSNLYYGLEYIHNTVNSQGLEENIETGDISKAVSRYPDGSTWQSMAAYASLKYKPNEKFVFQTGLRYNQIYIKADFTENNAFLNLPFEKTDNTSGALTGTAGVRSREPPSPSTRSFTTTATVSRSTREPIRAYVSTVRGVS